MGGAGTLGAIKKRCDEKYTTLLRNKHIPYGRMVRAEATNKSGNVVQTNVVSVRSGAFIVWDSLFGVDNIYCK